MGLVKRLLLLATVLAVALPAHASAASNPCRNAVYNDWYRDGKIASTYPLGCYRDALRHVRSDAAIYSSLRDDIRAAMQAAIRRSHGASVPGEVGKGFKPVGGGNVKSALVSINKTPHDPAPNGVATNASGSLTAATTSGSSTPLPILVLGGIAIALVAAGAVGAGVRHARNRQR
jgi:hypothetical protein